MSGARVPLPPAVRAPFTVYVNGVEQHEGEDFTFDEDAHALRFDRELAQEGRLGLWRWFLGSWGIGTYRPHHGVDVRYVDASGRTKVAEGLEPTTRGSDSSSPRAASDRATRERRSGADGT